jgi:hypothetical protein
MRKKEEYLSVRCNDLNIKGNSKAKASIGYCRVVVYATRCPFRIRKYTGKDQRRVQIFQDPHK